MGDRKRGFTIIELLVVISIIGILAGLLLPVLGHARKTARQTQCRSNLHAVAVAMRLYLDRYNDVMPAAAAMPSLHLNDAPSIAAVLAPFLPSREVLRCPEDNSRNFFASEGSSYEYRSIFGGRRVSDLFLSQKWGESAVPVMNDYEPFHGEPNTLGAMNYLFADGHVGDLGGS